MLATDIASLCKKLRLSRNLAENAMRLEANTHQEYLLRLLELEIERWENIRRDKLLKMQDSIPSKPLLTTSLMK